MIPRSNTLVSEISNNFVPQHKRKNKKELLQSGPKVLDHSGVFRSSQFLVDKKDGGYIGGPR